MHRFAWLAAPAGLVALCFAFSGLYRYGIDGPVTNSIDFRAFYCAGATLRAGRDPYRVQPLGACEDASLRDNGLRGSGRVLPAPFPPYALSLFAALSLLPIRSATQLWLAAGLMALGAGIVCLCRMTELRLAAVAASLVASLGFASLMLGQVVPLAFLGVVIAADRARRGDGRGAALGAVLAAVEPHLALPLWLGLAAGVREARRPLAIAGVALLALSLLWGIGLNVEFVREVLPLHARSELHNFSTQYSAASLLVALGAPAAFATMVGTAWYAAMLAAGLGLGLGLAKRYGDPAFAALAPVAAALFGGQFVHVTQIALALPFALLLFTKLPQSHAVRGIAIVAIAALAVPWETVAEAPAVWDHLPLHHALGAAPPLPPQRATDSSETPYTAFIDAFAERIDPRSTLEQAVWKLPTWLGLLAILALAASRCVPAMNSRIGFAGSRSMRSRAQ